MNVTALSGAVASIAQPAPTFRRGRSGLFVPDDRLMSGPFHLAQVLPLARRDTSLWLPGDVAVGLGDARVATPVLLDRPADVFERLVRDGISHALNGALPASPLA